VPAGQTRAKSRLADYECWVIGKEEGFERIPDLPPSRGVVTPVKEGVDVSHSRQGAGEVRNWLVEGFVVTLKKVYSP